MITHHCHECGMEVEESCADHPNEMVDSIYHAHKIATEQSMSLACGHQPSPHGEHTTGTVHLLDGREVCWDCGDAWQRERMRADNRLDAYLSQDGSTITTWSGGKLATVTHKVVRRVGFHGAERVYLNATDATGKQWFGNSPGEGMYARLRARKVRS